VTTSATAVVPVRSSSAAPHVAAEAHSSSVVCSRRRIISAIQAGNGRPVAAMAR
jgi:hypothetical protein